MLVNMNDLLLPAKELEHVGDNDGEGKLVNPGDYYTDPDLAADFLMKSVLLLV